MDGKQFGDVLDMVRTVIGYLEVAPSSEITRENVLHFARGIERRLAGTQPNEPEATQEADQALRPHVQDELESARLLGMSAERECSLRARLEAAERENDRNEREWAVAILAAVKERVALEDRLEEAVRLLREWRMLRGLIGEYAVLERVDAHLKLADERGTGGCNG